MKKVVSVVLVFAIVFSFTSAFADRHLFAHYSLFIDGEFYNSFFNAGFDFDSEVIDFYLYDDFKGGLFSRNKWTNGERISTGLVSADYIRNEDGFTLSFPDGTTFLGYWDQNDEDIWLNMGAGYFRLCPVHSFDISNDWKEK